MMCLLALFITLLLTHSANAEPLIYYVHNDHNGAPLMMTDQNQRVVWKANYTPFGEAKIEIEEVELPVRYKGQYYDKESGLHHNYYRDYNSKRGSYQQADPRGQLLDFSDPQRQVAARMGIKIPAQEQNQQANHLYAYAGNNPVMRTDSTGEFLDPVTIGLALWGIAYYNEAGDKISDPNGNIWGEFQDQDNVCTLGPVFGPVGNNCFPERCLNHDKCYDKNKCTASSWLSTALGGTKSCNQCNSGFFE